MSTKLFIAGSTGYIGGDAIYEILHAHPNGFDVTCLVRNSDKGAKLASQYPNVRLVYGTLDDTELLEREAATADIVLNFANADHEGAVKAFINGLVASSREKPGYIIHTCGTGILVFEDMKTKTYGEASTKIYDDWDGIAEVTSLPDYALHRSIDKVILAGGVDNPTKVKTAIVCPPTIYGKGRGPDNQRSQQLYDLSKCILKKKMGFQVGAGKTFWPNVHVADLSKIYLKLVEDATAGGGRATWNEMGYYFAENGEHVWGDISKLVTSEAYKHNLIPTDEVLSLSAEAVDELKPHGSILWGANSRCKAIRARKLLGWIPKEWSIQEEVPEAVKREAISLGLLEGHAAKAAGL